MAVRGLLMSESLQSLLLNSLFLIAPSFLIQQVEDRPVFLKHKTAVAFVAAAFAVVSCMSFPIRIASDVTVDLHWIPLLLTHAYIGYAASVPLSAVVLAYRLLFLDGDGGTQAFLVLAVFLVPAKLFARSGWSVRRKAAAGGALSAGFGLLCSAALQASGFRQAAEDAVWLLSALMLYGVVGAAFTAMIEDWTRKDAVKREQRRLLAEKLEKYDLVSQLAASVSHEVRNPLTVTRGFLQLLRSGGQSERERQYYIALAIEELERAQDIIGDYLSFAKQDPGTGGKAVFDASEEMAHIANVIKPYALIHSVLVETNFDASCRVYGHAGKYRQCVVNLCKNAIEAMPRGGTVRIELERDDRSNEVRLTIEDEGVGMDRLQLERIGTAYATTKEQGTGLGLSVVCRTVEDMGGRLRFRSVVGQGTTVYVHLPLQAAWGQSEAPYGARADSLQTGTGGFLR